MGKNNVIVNRWLSKKDRFADLINGCLFQGQQIVRPEQLEQIDRESDLLIPDGGNTGGSVSALQALQRYRDVAMRWNGEADLAVLAVEGQENIHYAMPVRTMIYDGLSYTEQIRAAWCGRENKKNNMTSGEFLSHFRKTDRLCPVITLVFYYGSAPWDGSRDLHEMIFGEVMNSRQEKLRKLIPNYSINLVDAERISDIKVFQTDLQYVLGLVKCRKEKKKLLDYAELHRTVFQKMAVDSFQALNVFLNSEKWMKGLDLLTGKKGEADMCRALEELYEDGVRDGMEKGIEKGMAEGKLLQLKELIAKKIQKGKDLNTIADELEETQEVIARLAGELTVLS